MKLLEDIFDDKNKDIIPAGTKIQIIDEGVLDWLSAIGAGVGAGIKHAGKFVLEVLNTLAQSGISRSDIENIRHQDLSVEEGVNAKSEIRAYEKKFQIKDKVTRNVIINLIKMKHANPEMKDHAERALKEITNKLEPKNKPNEETNT